MKNKITSAILLTGCMLLCACSYNSSSESTASQEATETPADSLVVTGPTFKNIDTALAAKINRTIENYILVKNALVSGNSADAKMSAESLLKSFNAIDTNSFSAEQKNAYKLSAVRIRENAEHVAMTNEIAHQREHFNLLSEGIYALAKSFGAGKELFYEFCPMANDNKGGFWISESEEIKNPYFGDEMLSCGEVKEKIR